MKSNEVKQFRRKSVWFTPEEQQLYENLNLSMKFHDFVKNSFYDTIDKKRQEKCSKN